MTGMPSPQARETLGSDGFPDAIRSAFPFPAAVDPNLEQALRHTLENPGSLIRPRLVMQIATAYGLDAARARDLAVALEYFHSASLLFDDLPCMDNASERRGAPCVHRVFGEAEAILAALALINRAYALTWRAVAGCDAGKQSRALEFVEDRLGVAGLLNGQSLDLQYASLPHTRETTERIARGKTVALIRLTLVLPAMLGDASRRELRLLEHIALLWGLAYQALDDLKDLLQGEDETGKTAARDVLLDRPNTAAVLGVGRAIVRVEKLVRTGQSALRRLVAMRRGLAFLEALGGKLEEELARICEGACSAAAGERR
ncbi:MAG: polyprenyl synthetase family protein [Acidobacteriota bacterium]